MVADRSVWRVRAVLVIGVVGFVVLFAVVRQLATSALRDQIDTTAEGRVIGLGLAIVPYALLVAGLLLARRQRLSASDRMAKTPIALAALATVGLMAGVLAIPGRYSSSADEEGFEHDAPGFSSAFVAGLFAGGLMTWLMVRRISRRTD